jgi:RimJ/RimL family protein N-acetyltransferase
VLRGELIGLRARTDQDIGIFETELHNDIETRIRATGRPWLPVAPGAADSPYRKPEDPAVVRFAVVELATADLAGEAVMSGLDLHNRHAEIGLVLRPAFRGKHLGTDVVRVLCHYGFTIRGLHRLQITTLADNHPMIAAAVRAGFVLEGTHRETAWINGAFADGVTLSLLSDEWSPTSLLFHSNLRSSAYDRSAVASRYEPDRACESRLQVRDAFDAAA